MGQDRPLAIFTATDSDHLPSHVLREVLRLSNAVRNGNAAEDEAYAVATASGLHLDRPIADSALPPGVRVVAWTLNGWYVEGSDPAATSELSQRLSQAGLKVTDQGTPEAYDEAPRGGGVGCGQLS